MKNRFLASSLFLLSSLGMLSAQSTLSAPKATPPAAPKQAPLNKPVQGELVETEEWGIPVVVDKNGQVRPNFKQPIKQVPSARTISPTSPEATTKPSPEMNSR